MMALLTLIVSLGPTPFLVLALVAFSQMLYGLGDPGPTSGSLC